jgi:putative DNA primase/helicase
MLAMVTSPDGKPSTIHRTFLTQSGTKAPIEAPRRLMPGSITKGVAVRLTAPAETLGIAEGIETALSATALTGIPCWAALNAAMLKGWQPPDLVTHVIIFADHDENFTGQAAAYALAHRLQNIDRRVTIRIPQPVGQDWNDVHRLSLSNAADGRVAASLMAAHDGTVDSLTAKGPAETFSNRQRHEYGS